MKHLKNERWSFTIAAVKRPEIHRERGVEIIILCRILSRHFDTLSATPKIFIEHAKEQNHKIAGGIPSERHSFLVLCSERAESAS